MADTLEVNGSIARYQPARWVRDVNGEDKPNVSPIALLCLIKYIAALEASYFNMRFNLRGRKIVHAISDGRGSPVRLTLWVAAGLLLLVPVIADFPWTAGDYVFAALLLFGSLGAYELVVRLTGSTAYRAAAGLAIAGVFLMTWSNGAVGITDSDADALFMLAPAVGLVGALLARFQASGMARAMFATAFTVGAIAVGALVAGIVPDFNTPFEILGISGFFVLLFAGSGLLFREAARE